MAPSQCILPGIDQPSIHTLAYLYAGVRIMRRRPHGRRGRRGQVGRVEDRPGVTDPASFRVSRCQVTPEPLLDGARPDYADSFEIRLRDPDSHPAEQWARVSLEQAAPVVRRIIQFVHAHVARFQLGPPADPDYVLGWQIVTSVPDVLHIETSGPLARAEIIARSVSPTRKTASTFLFYERPLTQFLWFAIGPLHRRIAPYLLARAATSLTSERHSLT